MGNEEKNEQESDQENLDRLIVSEEGVIAVGKNMVPGNDYSPRVEHTLDERYVTIEIFDARGDKNKYSGVSITDDYIDKDGYRVIKLECYSII